MAELTTQERQYWNSYLENLAPDEREKVREVSAGFAGNRQLTDELLELYLSGRKTAGSSAVEDFQTAGDPLPQKGNHWIYLDSQNEPRCILRTESIEIHRFLQVPAEVAKAEGEGDLSLEHWRQVHGDLYEPHLKDWGLQSLDDLTIITEFFKLVFR